MTVLASGLSLRSDLKTLKTEVFDSKLSKGPTSSKIMTLDTKSKLGLMTKSKLDLRPTQFKVGFQIDAYSIDHTVLIIYLKTIPRSTQRHLLQF